MDGAFLLTLTGARAGNCRGLAPWDSPSQWAGQLLSPSSGISQVQALLLHPCFLSLLNPHPLWPWPLQSPSNLDRPSSSILAPPVEDLPRRNSSSCVTVLPRSLPMLFIVCATKPQVFARAREIQPLQTFPPLIVCRLSPCMFYSRMKATVQDPMQCYSLTHHLCFRTSAACLLDLQNSHLTSPPGSPPSYLHPLLSELLPGCSPHPCTCHPVSIRALFLSF